MPYRLIHCELEGPVNFAWRLADTPFYGDRPDKAAAFGAAHRHLWEIPYVNLRNRKEILFCCSYNPYPTVFTNYSPEPFL